MAQFPCSMCGQRYRGAQQTAYPAIVDGTFAFREKMRLCPDDFSELVNLSWLRLVDTDDPAPSRDCTMCGAADARFSVFLTYYEAGQDRADLVGRVCAGPCALAAADALFGHQRAAEQLQALG